jgi:GNAT superfamily N-acetyltransferase
MSLVMSLVIRKAASRDASSFLSLVKALAKFENLEPPSQSAERRLIRDTFSKRRKKLNLLLAFVDRKPVAYALYFFTYSSFLARPTLYLEDIFVLEEFRRMGIGKKMFLRLVGEAQKRECGRMEWAVLTWNKNAKKFYERLGARRLSDWQLYRLDQKTIESIVNIRK